MRKTRLTRTDVPEPVAKDIERALSILKEEGCQEVYLFGSLVSGGATGESDIDLGIRSYPKRNFFRIYGRLMSDMEHQFDLVDFDANAAMFEVLSRVGEIERIA